MVTPTYGTTAPGGIDPFPIEQTLAQIVGTNNPAAAGGALDLYQLQNQVSKSNYGYDLAQQHEFAKQQLAQQLYEANLKGLGELKDPTVLEIAANAPQYQQLFGGAGQAAISDALRRSQTVQEAKNFAEAGKGTEGFSNAGYMVRAGDIPGLPPGANVTQTENARLAAERIRANAMLGAASIRANASGAATRAPGVSFTGGPRPDLGGATPNYTFNPKMSWEQNVQWFKDHGAIKSPVQPPAPDAQPGTPEAQPSTATPAAKPAVAPVQAVNDIKNQVRGAIEKMPVTATNKNMIEDIRAGYVGGQPNVVQKPNGEFVVVGKSKREYTKND